MCSDCKLKTKQSLDVVSALSADQVSTVFPRGVFVFFRGKFDRTGSTYRPPHHRSASQEERFSGFSFPSLLSKFSLQKSGKLYFESKTLDFFLNKHFLPRKLCYVFCAREVFWLGFLGIRFATTVQDTLM